jgi:hypothetical protein
MQVSQSVKADARTDLTLTRSGMKPVRVTLWSSRIENTFPYRDAILWGGDVDLLPQQLMVSMEVHDGDQMIFIPLSAYGDLGDVKLATAAQGARGFSLTLHGGAAATEYDAQLRFAGGYLVNRTVTLREFPQAGEQTNYSSPRSPRK